MTSKQRLVNVLVHSSAAAGSFWRLEHHGIPLPSFAQNPGSMLANKEGRTVVTEADNMGAKQECLPSWQLANKHRATLGHLNEGQGWSNIVSILKKKEMKKTK